MFVIMGIRRQRTCLIFNPVLETDDTEYKGISRDQMGCVNRVSARRSALVSEIPDIGETFRRLMIGARIA